MTFSRKDFIESLKTCMPGIETGGVHVDGADSFVFHDGKVSSYNGTVAVTVPLINHTEGNLEGAVDAGNLFKIISKLTKDEFDIESIDDDKWEIKAGRMKATIALKAFDYKSRVGMMDFGNEWMNVPDDFQAGMKACRMMHNKTIFSGIYFTGSTILSTDAYQINQYTLKYVNLPTFWLSDKCADVFIRLGDIKGLQTDGKWVHMIASNDAIVSAKLLAAKDYPYKKIADLLEKNLIEMPVQGVFPKELFKAVDRAITFGMTTEKGPVVRLSLSEDSIKVSSETASGSYEETVDWDVKPASFRPIEIYVNSDILSFALGNNCKFYIMENGKKAPSIFFTTDNSLHLFATYIVS